MSKKGAAQLFFQGVASARTNSAAGTTVGGGVSVGGGTLACGHLLYYCALPANVFASELHLLTFFFVFVLFFVLFLLS